MAEMSKQVKSVVVIGGGPGGLAAAKALLDEGLAPLVLETSEGVRTGAHVEHIERQNGDGFRVRYQDRSGQKIVEASAVVVASGRYNKPNNPRQMEKGEAKTPRGAKMGNCLLGLPAS
jgi:cation diffusion facilitator CzcD-associated flavoprotein CzcO